MYSPRSTTIINFSSYFAAARVELEREEAALGKPRATCNTVR
jgi:hypothetical protein